MLEFMNNGGIRLNRGDHEPMEIDFGEFTPAETDTILFTVKARAGRYEPVVFQKQVGTDGVINFYKADTEDLPLTKYVYDIKIIDEDGEPIFQHDPLPFVIGEVV